MITTKEQKIIKALRKNGRARMSTIAKEEKLPTSTATDILNRLEKKNLIEHKTHIKFDKIGYPIKIFALLKTNPQDRTYLKKELEKFPNINTLYELNSNYDFHMEALFANQEHYRDFFEELESKNLIMEKEIHPIIRNIYEEKFLTEENHFL